MIRRKILEKKIRITVGSVELEATLNDSGTAQTIWAALPIEAKGSRWGQEIYFTIPVQLDEEDPKEVVEKGDLAYWPSGNAFCVFWRTTPDNTTEECRPYSPVNVFGRVQGDPKVLDQAGSLDIRVEKK